MECAAKGRVATPCEPDPPTRRCGVCGVVSYCSPSHQVSDLRVPSIGLLFADITISERNYFALDFPFFLIHFLLVYVKMLHWEYHKEECKRLEEQMRRAPFISEFPFTFSDTLELQVITNLSSWYMIFISYHLKPGAYKLP